MTGATGESAVDDACACDACVRARRTRLAVREYETDVETNKDDDADDGMFHLGLDDLGGGAIRASDDDDDDAWGCGAVRESARERDGGATTTRVRRYARGDDRLDRQGDDADDDDY